MERIREFLFRLGSMSLPAESTSSLRDAFDTARERFEQGMDDDLNTAVALGAMFDLIRAANIALDRGELGTDLQGGIREWFVEIDRRLGIIPATDGASASASPVGAAGIEALIAERNEARRSRNFERADRVRGQLTDMGVVIEDTREGTRWRYK